VFDPNKPPETAAEEDAVAPKSELVPVLVVAVVVLPNKDEG